MEGYQADSQEANGFMRERGAFGDADAQAILQQLVDGIDYMHRRRVVHRDLKPENLLLQHVADSAFMLKIADFNSAKQVGVGLE